MTPQIEAIKSQLETQQNNFNNEVEQFSLRWTAVMPKVRRKTGTVGWAECSNI